MRWKAIMHTRLDSLHYSYVVLWLFFFFFCRTHAKHEKATRTRNLLDSVAFWKLPKAIKFWVCDHKTHYICRLWFSSVIFCPWCLYFICWAKKSKKHLLIALWDGLDCVQSFFLFESNNYCHAFLIPLLLAAGNLPCERKAALSSALSSQAKKSPTQLCSDA